MENKSKEDVADPKGFPSGQESNWSSDLRGNFYSKTWTTTYFWMKTTNLNPHPELKSNLESIFNEA